MTMKIDRILLPLLALTAICMFTGCSDDKDDVAPASLINCFCLPVDFFNDREYAGKLPFKGDTTDLRHCHRPIYREGFGFKLMGWLKIKDDNEYKGCYINSTQHNDLFQNLLAKWGDTGFPGVLPDDIACYLPMHMAITEVHICRWPKGGYFVDNGDYLDEELGVSISYRSFYEYIANGYRWPAGMTGPWRKVMLKDISESAPLNLLDASYIYIDLDREKAMEYVNEMGSLALLMRFSDKTGIYSSMQITDFTGLEQI